MPTSRIYINGGGNQSGFAPEEKRRETGGNERAWGRRGGKMERSVGGERERSSIDRENAGKWPSEVRRIGQHRRNDFDETVNTKGSSQSPIIDRSGSFFFLSNLFNAYFQTNDLWSLYGSYVYLILHFCTASCLYVNTFTSPSVISLSFSRRGSNFNLLKLVVFYIFILYILR